jgi:ABC-2 type transport system ATP-binding protein
MIDVDGLIFDYSSGRALHGISFVVRSGAVLALVGPNGAGKSTLMRCIAALDAPGAGRITVAGLDTQVDPRGVHALIGYLPDRFGLYEGLSVRRALTYAARSRGVAEADAANAVAQAAARMGLEARLDQMAAELSRGLRQRLAIGQAIVHQPCVLLLDEPAAGLDPEARRGLSSLIRELSGEGMTVIVSSHLLSELEDYCTDMLMLEQGRILGDGVVRAPARPSAESTEPTPPTRVQVDFSRPVAGLAERLARLGFHVERADDAFAVIQLPPDEEQEPIALAALIAAGLPVRGFTPVQTTLEDVYEATRAADGGA